MTKEPARILVVGGGYVGMYTALRLRRRWGRAFEQGSIQVVMVTSSPHMTYQPFLPEAAAGSISPRHVVVPLRRLLSGCQIVVGEVTAVDHAARVATVRTPDAEQVGSAPLEIRYDELVLSVGSVSDTPPVPGLAEHGIGVRTVDEAIGVRNHVLEQLDIASSTRDSTVREAALTFVFVGGGYAGVETLGALHDMARYVSRSYHNLRPEELRWVLVEPSGTLLPEASETVSRDAVRELRDRRIDVRLDTRLETCVHRIARLSDGSTHPTRTLVWAAGTRPHPLLATTGYPLDERGRVRCTPTLRVVGTAHAWSAGDAAAVPDLASEVAGASCAHTAHHAVRQARVLADNLVAALRGRQLTDYRYAHTGSMVSLGLHKGVARVYGRRLRGYPAWLGHRAYHLSRVPTFHRKARVLAEWTLAGLFTRDIVSLGSLGNPRAEVDMAVGTGRHQRAG